MVSISLKAHYDGVMIRLDEPFDLPEGADGALKERPPFQRSYEFIGWNPPLTDKPSAVGNEPAQGESQPGTGGDLMSEITE
jgi:hypothetical protein